jgi:hypothetical protein
MKTATRATGAENPACQALQSTIDQALKLLEAQHPMSDEAIHDVRKSLKDARAALRLLQDGMKKITFRTANSELRDAGRLLSPLRDARSLIDALDSLHDRYSDEFQGVELAPLQKILRMNLTGARRHLHLHLPRTSRDVKDATRLLKDCLALSEQEKFESIDSTLIEPGIRRLYRKGQRAYSEAEKKQTTLALHEWRKQVKYLLNAATAVRASNNVNTEKILKRTDRLADCLGQDHELAMLAQETARGVYARVDAEVIKALHGLIDRRQARLQRRALKLGKKIYGERPRVIAKRVMESVPPAATSSIGEKR